MNKDQAITALAALSQGTRLDVFRLLVKAGDAGMLSGELGTALDVRPNTMSANLSVLHSAGLVRNTREGRAIRYFADMAGMGRLLAFLTEDCCGGRPDLCRSMIADISCTDKGTSMPNRTYNVLFLCTGNSARSLIAEEVMNREGLGRFRGFSAGSRPTGAPNPHAIRVLKANNHDTDHLRSKSWDEFGGPDAPKMDFVFTVCDNAANEECPFWPGQPVSAHWGLPDPAAVDGTEAEVGLAFAETYRKLRNRISIFVNLPLDTLDGFALQNRLDDIGKTGALESDGTPA
ncbi:helix-turn-helix domain-containing protein [Fluviibacterium sp. DFM31]|uniref:Helix-turn-helix domain-containing protein n=1 Tax=Meridianimarinicoccus marinus TaxID=3231483 RepID=A0ABV3L8F2_9RHOB